MKFQALSRLLTFGEIALMEGFCKKTVYMRDSSVSIRQPFRRRCRCAASSSWASSSYFREILSIAECEAAWISHVCPVKIVNGRICSILIRFLPAETAIIFLSPGFSLWPCNAPVFTLHKVGHIYWGGNGKHAWHVCLRLLCERTVGWSKEDDHSGRFLNIVPGKSSSPKNWGFFFIVTFDLADAKTDFHVLQPSVKRG